MPERCPVDVAVVGELVLALDADDAPVLVEREVGHEELKQVVAVTVER